MNAASAFAIVAALATPLALACLLLLPARSRLRAAAAHVAPWAALPALVCTLPGVAAASLALPWALLGAEFALTALTRAFLLPAALLWLAAGQHAAGYLAGDPARRRFDFFFLLTLAGNLGLLFARDVATFYLCFTVMTFAAYGLVVHSGTPAARRAGRVYIVLAVLGEAALLAGLVIAARAAGDLAIASVPSAVAASPHRDLLVALLYVGFGVKAGALLLHVWLPLAHPVAPTPASAVLSGVMIKAGLLGWLQFLPIGAASLPGWGTALAVLGLAAAFYAAAVGLLQDDPKTVLAYSSVSQMGLMTLLVGVALASPSAAPAATAAAAFYALHHALAKGALFLGVAAAGDPRVGRAVLATGLALPALALAGAPATSGALAKAALAASGAKEALGVPGAALYASAIATTLLLAHFMRTALALRDSATPDHLLPRRCHAAWLGCVFASLLVPWWVAGDGASAALVPDALLDAAWPVAAGAMVWAVASARPRRGTDRRRAPWSRVPPGDVLVVFTSVGRPLGRVLQVAGTRPWEFLGRAWDHLRLRWEARRTSVARQARAVEWRLRRVALLIALALLLALGALGAWSG